MLKQITSQIFRETLILKSLEYHPFSLFLYLEWILLSISLLIDFRVGNFLAKPPFFATVNINYSLLFVTFFIFWMMGLKLPTSKKNRLIYSILEFLLILFANYVGGRGIGFAPSLLLILVIRSCLIFQTPGRLIVAVAVWLCFIFTLDATAPFNAPGKLFTINEEILKSILSSLKLTAGVMFSFVLTFVLLLANALVAERQSRQKMMLAHEQLRLYAMRIEDQATLLERNRIAREIHDSLGHLLTAQSIQIENSLVYIDSDIERTKSFLIEAKKLGASALKEVRFSVSTLLYNPLKGKTLEFAIRNLLADFQNQSQLEPEYYLEISQPLPQDINLAIYRIIQEALTNISKHSMTNNVIVDIKTSTSSLFLRVEDNGIGFDPKQNTTGFGLQSMRDRTNALGGQFYLNSEPGEGCSIMAIFPLSGLDL
jgi:signal transduction histidine kinase